MRKKIRYLIIGALLCGILTCPTFAASPFPDVDEYAPYADAVEFLNDAGIMMGDDKGNFNPNQIVTRAEMATIVCRMLDEAENLTVSNTFADVPAAHWANKYIAKAAELGIINGYGDGKFGPSDPVTYEQAVTMVVRAWDMDELAVAGGGYPNGYITLAYECGFLGGIEAQIGEGLSRAAVAQLLSNTLNF